MSPDHATHSTAPADGSFLPGPVLLLGAPGVGKGTQAQILMAKFGIPQISTGDLLRSNRANGTPLGLLAEETMRKGHLVTDGLVNEMVAERLLLPDCVSGFILDGYPRTIGQAEWLDAYLESSRSRAIAPSPGGQFTPRLPVVAIHITVSYDELLHRITGRRICPACKSIYNVYSNPPKHDAQCDLDGSSLVQRPDDTEPVFVQRMRTFEEQTQPVIGHYCDLGRFEKVNGEQPVEAVTSAIESALINFRHGLHEQPATCN